MSSEDRRPFNEKQYQNQEKFMMLLVVLCVLIMVHKFVECAALIETSLIDKGIAAAVPPCSFKSGNRRFAYAELERITVGLLCWISKLLITSFCIKF